ncbi:hypothetical protein FRX31_014664 [Thalictrum thalictroides]|uniref:Uncharacterized protein n=1 Tax=Thalictrum thalictroides TaxID=46969 RepID=A0A7J6WEC4_THATH|nr:hypothetical protein FRX31_014664 [Thalictrum thalictroides]
MSKAKMDPSNQSNTQKEEETMFSRIRKECLSFTTSVQESLQHKKAFFVGQGKKITARNEKEASEADLQTAKMQVEATNEAEQTKKKLEM